ncbi:hypothetical protein RND81_01G120600 [Saponaria officinalis]|uniref:Uncharacterized protein n=1 Tax=Saponaria officinalis TaxID=3572 RepID=A0AAW1NGE9_SAPOF
MISYCSVRMTEPIVSCTPTLEDKGVFRGVEEKVYALYTLKLFNVVVSWDNWLFGVMDNNVVFFIYIFDPVRFYCTSMEFFVGYLMVYVLHELCDCATWSLLPNMSCSRIVVMILTPKLLDDLYASWLSFDLRLDLNMRKHDIAVVRWVIDPGGYKGGLEMRKRPHQYKYRGERRVKDKRRDDGENYVFDPGGSSIIQVLGDKSVFVILQVSLVYNP